MSLGPDNRSRGYGTVLLASAEDAGRAIDMFNGYEWQSRMLEVRVDRVGGSIGEPGAMVVPAPVIVYQQPQQQFISASHPLYTSSQGQYQVPPSHFEQLQQHLAGQSVQGQQQQNPPSIPGRTLFVGNVRGSSQIHSPC